MSEISKQGVAFAAEEFIEEYKRKARELFPNDAGVCDPAIIELLKIAFWQGWKSREEFDGVLRKYLRKQK